MARQVRTTLELLNDKCFSVPYILLFQYHLSGGGGGRYDRINHCTLSYCLVDLWDTRTVEAKKINNVPT